MSAAFHDHFSDRAAAYAASRPVYPPELGEFLAGLAGRRACAWEAGCGSGQLTGILAERFERVEARDPSPEQLARLPARGNVRARVAPAQESGLSAGEADLAVAAQAAHWFDLDAYYSEVRRVVAPGGAVALICYELMQIDPEIDAVVNAFYYGDLERWWPPQRKHVESCYRELPFPFAEVAAPAIVMRGRWRLERLLGYVSTWSAVRALEQAGGAQRVDEFRGALAGVWGSASAAREIRWPLSIRAGRVG